MKNITILFVMVFLFVGLAGFVLAEPAQDVAGGQEGIGNVVASEIQNRVQVISGNYRNANGDQMQIQQQTNHRVRLEVGNVSADCPLNLTQEEFENRTRLYAGLSNGKTSEVKIMPDVASERALEILNLQVCSDENNCRIETYCTKS